MGAAVDCCSGDPSQNDSNMETTYNQDTKEGNTDTDTDNNRSSNGYEKESKPTTKQSIPDDSYLKPTNDNDEVEESLLVPSTLSAVGDEHDPPPPSDYEDNDQYAIKPDITDDDDDDDDNDNDDNPEYIADEDNDNKPELNNVYDGDKEDNEMDKKPKEPKQDEDEQEDEEEVIIKKEEEEKPKHRQLIILENDDLRERSVNLVTGDNKEFIKFLKKILKSKLNEKIWKKCDPHNTGKIETEKFKYFWTLPVTLFKVAVYQRKHGNKQKPKLDQKDLKKEFSHLATWIITKYGEKQPDGGYTFILQKENFSKDIVEYVTNYASNKGVLNQDY